MFKRCLTVVYLSHLLSVTDQAINTIKILQYSSRSDPSYAKVNVSIIDRTINIDVKLFRDVTDPSVRVLVREYNRNIAKKWHDQIYNSCDLKKQMIRNPIAFLLDEIVRKYTNFSVACNYPPGLYSLRNFAPGTAGMPLAFFHRPNAVVVANITLFDVDKANAIVRFDGAVKIIKV